MNVNVANGRGLKQKSHFAWRRKLGPSKSLEAGLEALQNKIYHWQAGQNELGLTVLLVVRNPVPLLCQQTFQDGCSS
jgi:hypothetical protein